LAAKLMPLLRGKISRDEYKLGHFDDSAAVLEFVCSRDLQPLAALGTSCPDHFLRTKIRPFVIDFDPLKPDFDKLVAGLDQALEEYRAGYVAYYERCKHDNSPAVRDANPIIYLIPGVGMLSFAKDKATARIAGEFYVNAINVMRGANGVAGGSEAAAHAEAEKPGRPHRAGHRRRRRHRPGGRQAAAAGRRLRHVDRHRSGSAVAGAHRSGQVGRQGQRWQHRRQYHQRGSG
jgi:hypothetical protein